MVNILKSKLRTKLLEYYFSQPEAEPYVRELAKIIKEDPTNLSRELSRLEDDGIFNSTLRGKQKYFKLNTGFLFYKELKSIVAKTVGIEKRLVDAVGTIDDIEVCFVYGSYASEKERAGSDIDLFVIGDKVKVDLFLDRISILEKQLGREVNYRIYSMLDFNKAVKEKNSFVINVLKNKKIFIKGDEKDIRKFN